MAGVSPLVAELKAREEAGKTVTIGLAGCGQMGADIMVQLNRMPGLRLGAVAEMRPPQARAAAAMAGFTEDRTVYAETPSAVDAAIGTGRIAITSDPAVLARSSRIDVVIDATGNPNTGAQFALDSIANGKHVVMLNVEADITIGRHLHGEAKRAGVVYTGAAGDEPAATLELIGFAQSIGLEVVCAGKGKNNPLKWDAVPADYEAEARSRNMNARMLVEFVDGSKTMVEMVAIANCTGLVPDVPGMHGPAAAGDELASVLIPKEHGGVLSRKGCVDYSIGKGVAPGVFCIVTTDHPRLQERLIDLKVGKGPYFALTRPYHLTSLEVPLSAARAVLHGQADMAPLAQPVAECATVAKRDLSPGENLGRIGETDYRAWAMTHAEARNANAVPLGLAQGAKVLKAIKSGEPLTYGNCAPDESLLITQIRRRLDQSDTRLHAL
ncbi:homoserine dehydrogenase [Aestuariivirga sp.]|uniref:NAD(P)H-dependent oxidoreductase n=1 Tax=Aestuariivirga sp. TaxID=2650926 RepID=UPI0025C64F30|nr:homoserine dehydrogenase [Aestuariivirga sp.]